MGAVVFRNSEADYLQWITENSDGYVLTTTASAPTSYMSLHRANCRMISSYMKNMAKGAFTERGYIKICSTHQGELLAWIGNQGGSGFSKRCTICKPDAIVLTDAVKPSDVTFDERVGKSLASPTAAREARLRIAPKRPSFSITRVITFDRNPDVVATVLLRADGKCEACGNAAPFIRASNRTPYLEVHHVIRLADGGEDTVNNAVALCPNCHRRSHYGASDG